MPVVGKESHWMPDPDELPRILEITVGDLLDQAAERCGDREAVVYSAYREMGIDLRWRYHELRERARRVARALIASGLETGDRIGLWSTNTPQWLELQFGAAYAGVVLVPLNPLYRLREVSYVLGQSGAVACFALPEDRGTSLWAILDKAASSLPELRLRVPIGDAPGANGPSWEEWVAEGTAVSENALERRRRAITPAHTSQIQFTSGTTGFPKGAELSNLGLANNGRLFAARAQLRDGGRHCNPMPFFHCGGSVLSTLGAVATASAQMPVVTFDPGRMVRTIDDERCTSASAVPTMLIALEEEERRSDCSLESLEIVVTGGSPVPVDVERRWIMRFGVRFTITYGLTEASPVITQSSPDDPEELQIATCGRPLPHVEVDVVDPLTSKRVPIGQQGELRTRGWLVMKGYWQNQTATTDAISGDGFLRTGDLARLDERGYVSITGRAKEMIIRGGENIYPAEIEDAIRELPGVLDVAVVGVPSERYGEEVAAFLRLSQDAELDEEEIRATLRSRIARFKIPRHVLVIDEFPLTASGKIQRFRLRERFVDEQAPRATR
jgi:acyl-CoA synthetase (AMP-forming)/AMP-acid ligase II